MNVCVVRSPRRKKTVEAKLIGGELRIYLPAWMSRVEERRWVQRAVERLKAPPSSCKFKSSPELLERGRELNRRYFGNCLPPFTIRYVPNQRKRYGSCTSATASIRISERLEKMPAWVRDYVIVHELAHLLEPNHSKRFWELVYRYPQAAEARLYLEANPL